MGMADPSPLERLRRRLALAVGENAVFDGWSRQAVDSAAGQLGIDPAQARLAMPTTRAGMIDVYIQEVDRGLQAYFTPERIGGLKIREKIRALIWRRLEIMAPAREAVRRALSILALPQNLPLALRISWRTADSMWRIAGDTSTDFNHYTKRMTLGAVYGSTLLVWLKANSHDLRVWGTHLGMVLVKSLIAMVIGALVALHESAGPGHLGPLAAKLRERVLVFAKSFRDVALSQIRISALNTLLTGIYLVIVMPLLGVQLPLVKTMIAVTFLAGLLPIVGNLISNTVIVLISLSVSLGAAVGSLVFLVLIHKLEYFVNARIVGTRIHARAWELLLAMLVLESWHGGAGLVAAPIFYAYVKQELADRGLV